MGHCPELEICAWLLQLQVILLPLGHFAQPDICLFYLAIFLLSFCIAGHLPFVARTFDPASFRIAGHLLPVLRTIAPMSFCIAGPFIQDFCQSVILHSREFASCPYGIFAQPDICPLKLVLLPLCHFAQSDICSWSQKVY